MNLNELAKDIHATAVEKGWYESERSFPEVLMLVVSELSEALEDYREGEQIGEWRWRIVHKHDESLYEKPTGIPIELADAIIRILDICGYYNIDIEQAISEKMGYNRTRTYRHGGKIA